MATASGPGAGSALLRKATGWSAKVFALDPAGLNWPRGVAVLDVLLVPLVVFWSIGYEQYLLSALFAVLFAVLADPGGGYVHRASHIAAFGLAGTAMTALGFGVGPDAWGWSVLVAFVITLVSGLMIAFGTRRFATALLLNLWLVVALALGYNLSRHTHVTSYVWAQVVAWAAGTALWIVVASLWWLIGGRRELPQPIAELPGDTARRELTPPLIAFAVIRAVAIAACVALAFGLDLSHGVWMPIAAMVAMKPSLEQTSLVASQRLSGAAIGAVAAALLLLIPTSEHGLRLFAVTRGLEVVALVLFVHGVAIRFWNYALYCAAIAAGVLILVDLAQPSDYAAEGYRVLWTLCGVGIGTFALLLAGLLAKRRSQGPSQPA